MDDENYFSLEQQEIRNARAREFKTLETHYRNKLKSQGFSIEPYWHLDKKDIDFKSLPNRNTELLSSDYTIYSIHLNHLKEKLPSDHWLRGNLYYRKNDGNNIKITKILKNWEDKAKLIPIIILCLPEDNLISIHDGHHRLKVCHYFHIKLIPIIVANDMIPAFHKIIYPETVVQYGAS